MNRLGCLLLMAHCLAAQSMISVKAGQVSFTEGKVFLDGNPLEVTRTHFADVKENSVVRTESGRAEVLLGPCAAMWMGEDASFRMITSRLIDTRIDWLTGTAVVETGGMSNSNKLTLVMKDAEVVADRNALFRIEIGPPPILKVATGKASVESGGQEITVAAGRMLMANRVTINGLSTMNGAAEVKKMEKAKPDALDEWAKRRAMELARASDLARQDKAREYGVETSAGQAATQVDTAQVDTAPGRRVYGMGAPSPLPAGSQADTAGLGFCRPR